MRHEVGQVSRTTPSRVPCRELITLLCVPGAQGRRGARSVLLGGLGVLLGSGGFRAQGLGFRGSGLGCRV